MIEERERADNDLPGKEILEAYFPQAMQFFFPHISYVHITFVQQKSHLFHTVLI